jgi:hypothetical protein
MIPWRGLMFIFYESVEEFWGKGVKLMGWTLLASYGRNFSYVHWLSRCKLVTPSITCDHAWFSPQSNYGRAPSKAAIIFCYSFPHLMSCSSFQSEFCGMNIVSNLWVYSCQNLSVLSSWPGTCNDVRFVRLTRIRWGVVDEEAAKGLPSRPVEDGAKRLWNGFCILNYSNRGGRHVIVRDCPAI